MWVHLQGVGALARCGCTCKVWLVWLVWVVRVRAGRVSWLAAASCMEHAWHPPLLHCTSDGITCIARIEASLPGAHGASRSMCAWQAASSAACAPGRQLTGSWQAASSA